MERKHYSPRRIAKIFKCSSTPVDYMVKLIDIHGLSIVKRNKYKQYSAEDRIRSRITETDTETSEAKHEAFDRERILKKIR